MTRPELHALVDIVMDAREKYPNYEFYLHVEYNIQFYHVNYKYLSDYNYPTFSDFTQAVKEYIKTLETK